MHTFPASIQSTSPEVVVDGLPGRELMGQKPPGTATLDDVEDSVEDLVPLLLKHVTSEWPNEELGISNEFGLYRNG